MNVDLNKEGHMLFGKTTSRKITQICDNLCRAEKIRDQNLMALLVQGPRV